MNALPTTKPTTSYYNYMYYTLFITNKKPTKLKYRNGKGLLTSKILPVMITSSKTTVLFGVK